MNCALGSGCKVLKKINAIEFAGFTNKVTTMAIDDSSTK